MVSIIIPTLNEGSTIKDTLESIKNLNYPKSRIETIVVDSGSTDNTIYVVKQYKNVKLVVDNTLNKPQARNKGFSICKGDFVFPFNGHATLEPDTINILISKFKDNIGGVGCPNHTPNKDTKGNVIGKLMQSILAGGGSKTFTQNANYKKDRFVNHLPFVIYKREVFEKVGDYDEYIVDGEDAEFNIRVRNFFYKLLFTPDTFINLFKPSSFKTLFNKMYKYGIARSLIMQKHPDGRTLLYLYPNLLLTVGFVTFLLLIFQVLPLVVIPTGIVLYGVACLICSYKKGGLFCMAYGLVVFPSIHFGYTLGLIKGYFSRESDMV